MRYTLKNIDSTSTELRRRMSAEELPHGYCISADFQTAGHGQATNHWESEDGKNLLFSLLLRPSVIPASEQFVITEIVTLAIINALQDYIRQRITIKWPNDIYVGDKKLCGILIENALCGPTIDTCIVGIGININQELFISNAPNPISLKQLNGRDNDREEIFEEIYQNILNYYDYYADMSDRFNCQSTVLSDAQKQDGAVLSPCLRGTSGAEGVNNSQLSTIRQSLHYEYMNNLYRRVGYHNYSTPEGEKFSAEIEEIGPQGHLTLRLQSG
ncbi:MAG: biotin--[acetyl-CoA-carboxylase] ligase, partial [Paludibacteraceae bacterium]|nr:biotin--[acetyl-CoA-carboxylase] ligase [Paludibacteraceae bacterium]